MEINRVVLAKFDGQPDSNGVAFSPNVKFGGKEEVPLFENLDRTNLPIGRVFNIRHEGDVLVGDVMITDDKFAVKSLLDHAVLAISGNIVSEGDGKTVTEFKTTSVGLIPDTLSADSSLEPLGKYLKDEENEKS